MRIYGSGRPLPGPALVAAAPGRWPGPGRLPVVTRAAAAELSAGDEVEAAAADGGLGGVMLTFTNTTEGAILHWGSLKGVRLTAAQQDEH